MNSELLLQKISSVLKEYDSLNQITGRKFNIFQIANISTDEVAICRVLHELDQCQ